MGVASGSTILPRSDELHLTNTLFSAFCLFDIRFLAARLIAALAPPRRVDRGWRRWPTPTPKRRLAWIAQRCRANCVEIPSTIFDGHPAPIPTRKAVC